jgi:hypothetical protein
MATLSINDVTIRLPRYVVGLVKMALNLPCYPRLVPRGRDRVFSERARRFIMSSIRRRLFESGRVWQFDRTERIHR